MATYFNVSCHVMCEIASSSESGVGLRATADGVWPREVSASAEVGPMATSCGGEGLRGCIRLQVCVPMHRSCDHKSGPWGHVIRSYVT